MEHFDDDDDDDVQHWQTGNRGTLNKTSPINPGGFNDDDVQDWQTANRGVSVKMTRPINPGGFNDDVQDWELGNVRGRNQARMTIPLNPGAGFNDDVLDRQLAAFFRGKNIQLRTTIFQNPGAGAVNDDVQEEGKVLLRRKCKYSKFKSQSSRLPPIFLSKSRFRLSRQVQVLNTQERERKHFSHCHPLRPYKVPEMDAVICSGCELELCGPAYGCTRCGFFLHKSCFELPRQIRHKSHPHHALTLVPSSPYKWIGTGTFICNGCDDHGSGFDFHCATCNYDLHVDCAYLPKTLDCNDHEHYLTLFYFVPFDLKNGAIEICDICGIQIASNRWGYYCVDCDYAAHLECATAHAVESNEFQLSATQNQLKLLEL